MRNATLDLVTVLMLGMLLFSSWALGGRASFALPSMALIGWCALVPLVIFAHNVWRHRQRVSRCDVLYLLPWVLLCGYLWLSLQNPMYEALGKNSRGILRGIESNAMLPGVVLAERSAPLVGMFTGVLVLAAAGWLMVRDRARLRMILLLSFVNCVVLSIIGTFFYLSGEEKILGIADPVSNLTFSSFRYRNHWAAYAVLHLAVGLGLFNHYGYHSRGREQRGGHHWALLTGCTLIALTIPLSGSRSGMILLVLVALAWLLQRLRRASSVQRKSLLTGTAVLGVLGVAGLWLVAGDVIEQRVVEQTFDELREEGQETSIRIRIVDLPQVTVAMALDRPWLGWGLGSYYYLFPKYGRDLFPRQSAEFAHSDWLQWWVELGLIGLTLFIATPLLLYGKFRRVASRTGFMPSLFAGIAVLMLFAVWGFPFGKPAVFAHTLLFFALGSAYAFSRE